MRSTICMEKKMSVKNVRMTRSLANVTNCEFLLRSSRSPLKKDAIAFASPAMVKRPSTSEKVVEIPSNITQFANPKVVKIHEILPQSSRRRPEKVAKVSTSPAKRPQLSDKIREIPSKRPKIEIEEPNEAQCDQIDELSAVSNYRDILIKVFTDGYCDIPARLKLPTPPKCVFNMQTCHEQHYNNENINLMIDGPNLKNFLNNENPMLFLHLVEMMRCQDKFLDGDTLQLLVELILCVNENCDANGNYSANGVIDGATIAFLNILNTYPPCWAATKKTYRQLLVGPILTEGYLAKDGFDKDQSLLMNIIGSMEQMLRLDSADLFKTKLSSDSESDDLMNFHVWESKNSQKYKFQRLKRNEKIDRLFIVMELLVQTMEYDLVNWMVKYARCPNGKMAHIDKIPFIASILWSNDAHRQVNATIKRIIDLFIDYVSIDFPKKKISILSRLVNLMYTTLDLCDNKMSIETIVYPNVAGNVYNSSDYFCYTFYNRMRANQASSAKLCVKLIESVNLPSLKLYVITKFVGDLGYSGIALNPRSIYKALIKVSRTYTDNDAIDGGDAKNGAKEVIDIYPFMQTMKKKCSSTISDREYAKVLMIALQAYADIHHIVEIRECLIRGLKLSNNTDVQRFQHESPKFKLKVFNERYMRRNGSKLIAEQFAQAKDDRICENCISQPLNAVIQINPDLEMEKMYRDDLKFYDIIMLDAYGVLKRLLGKV